MPIVTQPALRLIGVPAVPPTVLLSKPRLLPAQAPARGLLIRPNYPEAHLNYVITLERLGRTADARVEHEKFLADVPFALHDMAKHVRAHLSVLL
jgi:hypothetical protein